MVILEFRLNYAKIIAFGRIALSHPAIASIVSRRGFLSSQAAFMTELSAASNSAEETTLVRSDMNLVWLDMEMTGLDPDNDRIIEIAVVVTNSTLNRMVEGPVLAIHQSDETLVRMDEWNRNTHGRSGLTERVKASTVNEAEATRQIRDFLGQYVPPGKSPMCGNSICQDRRFMARWMPELETFFHYRNLDVSTLKELCRRWQPAIYKGFQKRAMHTALADIHESIDELKYYRQHFLIPSAPAADAS
ncbi:3'-to-5' oligoribonuclease (orn) [Candidatus Paraburkholderia kirkii UZHbot1]|uniref:Oligoribonuclease n=1 Tax=Candidatus Paraburkholderia kirkii UZHbot1 TaxID=1055526 RepID=G4M5R1_9BURK|nr:3'-to-5' oligoribonuclease (orn) [Candidatus Paraburkholderia kirkii UZHbot1]